MECRERLIRLGQAVYERHLVNGAAGNLSIRDENGEIYITARGSRLGFLKQEDIVVIDAVGHSQGEKEPTSEYLLHTLMYKRYPDVRVVVHTHSAYATAAAVIREDIPPIVDEMTILIGGGIRVAQYAAPGTQRLAENAMEAMGNRKAALLANHGAIIAAADDAEAVKLAELCEHAAQVYLCARSAGEVHTISQEAFERQMQTYLKKTKRGV